MSGTAGSAVVTVQLLREGKGPARVVATFSRAMTVAQLFERVRPSQLLYCGQDAPSLARDEDDDDQDLIRVRDASGVFIHLDHGSGSAFDAGYYFLLGVKPSEAKAW
jgi:hypothetical protein